MHDADGVRLVARALDFAARRHSAQRRHGETIPYVNHLAEVAHLLAEAGADAELVAAGLLHDTIEDQDVTAAELAEAFGAAVAALVVEVSDDTALHWTERKRLEEAGTPHKSARARLLKLADKTSNLRSIAASSAGWSIPRQREYVAWAARVVAPAHGVSATLDETFAAARTAALAAIDRRAQVQAD